MKQGGNPSHNFLAHAGLITNEAGRVFEPPCGRLELPWLIDVSRERARQAREYFERTKAADGETKMGWFIASTEPEFEGLRHLLKKDWRRALKAWKGGSLYNLHNRATLHRALYYCKDSERPEAHIRECLRLYHHLSELAPKQTFYRFLQEELIEHLIESVKECHQRGDDESASRSLKVLAQTVGLVAVEDLQERFFGKELEALRRSSARIQKELLAYQGQAQAPPEDLLASCDDQLLNRIIPEAARFSHKLVEGSKERKEVEQIVAQACDVLSQSYVKAKDARSGKRWLGEAMRWEPSVVQDWRSLPEEDFGDEESAVICFPEKEQEQEESPSPLGNFVFGIQANVVSAEVGQSREEWLESVYTAFVPVFPMRRFAAYRNLETGDVGYFLRIPLTTWDHVRQGFAVLLLSFLLTVGTFTVLDVLRNSAGPDQAEVQAVTSEDIEKVVGRLKELAQKEARLTALPKRNAEQEKELKSLQTRRVELIEELEKLEQDRRK
jgi:hypothetical protein